MPETLVLSAPISFITRTIRDFVTPRFTLNSTMCTTIEVRSFRCGLASQRSATRSKRSLRSSSSPRSSVRPRLWIDRRQHRRIELELEVSEADFGRPARVQLQADAAASRGGGVVDVGGHVTIERDAHARAGADDLVGIPVALLHELGAATVDEDAASVLLVELAPPAGADVGLATFDFSRVRSAGERLGPELHAAVADVVDQDDVEREAEVAELEVAHEEGVLRDALRGLADDL